MKARDAGGSVTPKCKRCNKRRAMVGKFCFVCAHKIWGYP